MTETVQQPTALPAPPAAQPVQTDAKIVEEKPKPEHAEVEFLTPEPPVPFRQFAFLLIARTIAFLIPAISGAYLVFQVFLPGITEFGFYLKVSEFPDWFQWVMPTALRFLVVLIWIAVTVDSVFSVQIIGEWQRRNRFTNGTFKSCAEKGFKLKWAVFQGWGQILDMRIRISRWKANKVMTADGVLVDLQMVGNFAISKKEPWRAEIDVDNFNAYCLSKAEAIPRAVAGTFALRHLQSKAAENELRKQWQEAVGNIAEISYMAITDTDFSEDLVKALAQKPVGKARAEGRLAARMTDLRTVQRGIEIGSLLQARGLQVEPGQLAWFLEQYDKAIEAGTGGKGTYVFGLEGLIQGLKNNDSQVLRIIEELLKQQGGRQEPRSDQG